MKPGPLTLANRVTILRILLIPGFVLAVMYYGAGHRAGSPNELWRIAAVFIFGAASLTDGLDGYIARSRDQKTVLGTYLDPIADKALLVSALIVLSVGSGNAFEELPLWFPVLVISRDTVLIIGVLLIHFLGGHIAVRPSALGKLATATQMIAVGWILCRFNVPPASLFVMAAGGFTLLSGIQYVWRGSRFLNVAQSPAGP